MTRLTSKNPATGEVIQELETTPPESLAVIFETARAAQSRWSVISPKKRAELLFQTREVLLNHVDDCAELISNENGKPPFEAMINELLPSADMLTYFGKKAPKLLRDKSIKLVMMKHRKSYLQYWPLGVVAVISPWNYPFFLPFADILTALVTGNAVVFKPSEVTPLIGLKIQSLFEEAGIMPGLLQTVIGDGSLGAAIVQQRPDKIFFTGSVGTGKKIMAAAAEHLIPVNLELGGKDAMIVLPDADIDYATSAALWGGFSNSGQVCASTERILVHESIAAPFLLGLKEKIGKLRHLPQAESGHYDLGATTFERQKAVYSAQIDSAKAQGAEFVTGGDFSADRTYLNPTVVTGPQIETMDIYNEETFGPVVAVTKFKSVAEAIEKANRSRYGLLASVITKNLPLGEQVARQLAVGTVTINEVIYTAGLGETPWGGIKDSGFGRTHSDMGIQEFCNIRHIHKPASSLFIFKSPWWFPYTPFQFAMFRALFETYRGSRLARLKALPHLLWNLVQYIKNEKRL